MLMRRPLRTPPWPRRGETLASLQLGGSAAADYAAQKLGLASLSGSNTNKWGCMKLLPIVERLG